MGEERCSLLRRSSLRRLTCPVDHVRLLQYVSACYAAWNRADCDWCIGNILILRGNIEILPPDRTSVSYEQLAHLVGEYLLTSCPDVDISAALSIMPVTRSTSCFGLACAAY